MDRVVPRGEVTVIAKHWRNDCSSSSRVRFNVLRNVGLNRLRSPAFIAILNQVMRIQTHFKEDSVGHGTKLECKWVVRL